MSRSDWKGVHNGAFDEMDRLLHKWPEAVFTGSEKWANHFHCSRCARHYFYPYGLKRHAGRCPFRFVATIAEQPLHEEGPSTEILRASKITCESAKAEKRVLEELSLWTRREAEWDFPILREDNWLIPEFKSLAFVLTKHDHYVSHLVFREKLVAEERKAWRFSLPPDKSKPGELCEIGWALGEIFTARSERGRGYARLLLGIALEHIQEKPSSIGFLSPLTASGQKFVMSLDLDHIAFTDS